MSSRRTSGPDVVYERTPGAASAALPPRYRPRRWSLFQAWPIKFVAGDWDNESDENVIESVTLTYDIFDLVQ